MAHDMVKVELEKHYPYSDFQGWYDSLQDFEKEVWTHIAKDSRRTENNMILLTKKAIEIYCLEMGIDEIPNSEDYLEKIWKKLINALTLSSLLERGLIKISSGKLTLLVEPKFEVTKKGKEYLK